MRMGIFLLYAQHYRAVMPMGKRWKLERALLFSKCD